MQKKWVAHYTVVEAADSVYQEPRERTYHACAACYREYYTEGEMIEYPYKWCKNYKTIEGALFKKDSISLEFVPREELTEGQMKVLKFLEEEVIHAG